MTSNFEIPEKQLSDDTILHVLVLFPCSSCNGTGEIMHSLWKEYHKRFTKFPNMTYKERMQETDKWWANKGKAHNMPYEDKNNWPDEYIECYECEGRTGYLKWVDINALLTNPDQVLRNERKSMRKNSCELSE